MAIKPSTSVKPVNEFVKRNRQTAYAIMTGNKGSFIIMVGNASTKNADDLKVVSFVRIKCA